MPDTDPVPGRSKSLIEQIDGRIMVVDDFFDDFESLRAKWLDLDYHGTVNGADGVEYPYISTEVPGREQVVETLGEPVDLFIRLSPAGVFAPHPVHSDTLQSDVTLLVYLNDPPPGIEAGTAMVAHRATGMSTSPLDTDELAVWEKDYRDPDKWETNHLITMHANRAVLFPSCLMHMALPYGGFGEDLETARMVMTGFFR